MAARRSARSSRGPTRARRTSPARGPEQDAQGRFKVACPRCNAGYAVPEAHLDDVLTCRNCRSAFTPRRALEGPGRRTKSSTGVKTIIPALIFIVPFVIVVIVWNALQSEPPPPVKAPPPPPLLTESHPAYKAFVEFSSAVAKKNELSFATSLSYVSVYEQRKEKDAPRYDFMSADERKAFKATVAKLLFDDEEGRVFRDFAPTGLDSRTVLPKDPQELTFEVEMGEYLRKGYRGPAFVEAKAARYGSLWKVTAWRVLEIPKAPRKPKPRRKPHPKIARPHLETVVVEGVEYKKRVSDPVPLEHLESTPAPLRKEIDDKIAALMDPQSNGIQLGRARRRLEEIGTPAIPRLLNTFYLTKGTTAAEREGLRNVVETFNRLTGAGLRYLQGLQGEAMGSSDELRELALKQGFAFWYDNFDKKLDPFAEEDEDLSIVNPGKAPKTGPKKSPAGGGKKPTGAKR